MGQKQDGRFCGMCQKNVMAVGQTPNHLLHFVISMFTIGLWVIPWIIISASSSGGYRCTQCGAKV